MKNIIKTLLCLWSISAFSTEALNALAPGDNRDDPEENYNRLITLEKYTKNISKDVEAIHKKMEENFAKKMAKEVKSLEDKIKALKESKFLESKKKNQEVNISQEKLDKFEEDIKLLRVKNERLELEIQNLKELTKNQD